MSKRGLARGFCRKTGVIALLIILLSLLVTPATASPELNKWLQVNIPTGGAGGNWVLASGSDVRHLTTGVDGSLYACGTDLTYTLYKSTDGGFRWSYIGDVRDSIVAIATSPTDASFLCYATTSTVYLSTDGGKSFESLPAGPGGAGSGNVVITSLAVAHLNKHHLIAGTRDTDTAQFGGVYTLDMEQVVPAWVDTSIGSYDVCAVAASPTSQTDSQLVAVVTDETDTFVVTRFGDAAWSATIGDARLDQDNSGGSVVAVSAAIAFPEDYDSDASSGNYIQFIGVNTGSGIGDVYKISGSEAPGASSATDLNAGAAYNGSNIDICGLAVKGDAAKTTLLAGAAASAQTYLSGDGGISWRKSRKEPSGSSQTYVLFAPGSDLAYAVTSGTESAFSISRDGITWNQTGLIDTTMSAIIDLAPSPSYSQDGTLFLLTFGGKHSLWRSSDEGTTWERTFSSGLANVDSLALLELSPQYGSNSQVVLLTGSSNGNPVIWKSTDNGQSFFTYQAVDPVTKAALSIDTWAVVSDTELFIGSYDGTKSLVYYSINSGFVYSAGKQAGSQSPNSMALSPDYQQDGSVLFGNSGGWVYWSNDNGSSFKPLPTDATTAPLTGAISVAFDPGFAKNHIVYATSNTADKGVYRFTIGASTAWERIDGTLPAGARLNQLAVSPEGTLYAANARAGGGMERCLNPTYSLGPSFETVTRGLNDNAILSGLWQCGGRLWSIDTANNKLMTFLESLSAPVSPTSPPDGAPGVGTINNHNIINVSLDWDASSGATSYQWQLDYDTDFSSVPTGFEGTTQASSVRLPALEPATTYYWRVRATEPVQGPWSDKWSFTTSLTGETVALKPEYPSAGASNVAISPLFQWSAVNGADAYELLVAAEADFANPAITKVGDYALSATAWQCNVNLDYETTYSWKVRARTNSTHSAWIAASAFTTEPLPAPPPETPEPTPETLPPSLPPAPQIAKPLTLPMPQLQLSPTTAPPALTPLPPPLPAPPGPLPPATPEPPTWLAYLIGGLVLAIILLTITVLVIVTAVIRRE